MAASNFLEYDADDVDARLNTDRVLVMATDQGRVVVSMTPEVLERLGLRIAAGTRRYPRTAYAASESDFGDEFEDEPREAG